GERRRSQILVLDVDAAARGRDRIEIQLLHLAYLGTPREAGLGTGQRDLDVPELRGEGRRPRIDPELRGPDLLARGAAPAVPSERPERDRGRAADGNLHVVERPVGTSR